jgi:AraC family transcriptional regulator, regulatory protein of adaptative response / methylated-DNA-[protein]-cysteine methyltransferase
MATTTLAAEPPTTMHRTSAPRPPDVERACRLYARIERAIAIVREQPESAADLPALARRLGVSASWLQRTFSAWAGVSPKRFAQALADVRARVLLARGEDVLGAALGAGLSGPGRLHDVLVKVSACSPGEVRSGGRGLVFHVGRGPTPFGSAGVVVTPRGIHRLAFLEGAEGLAGLLAATRRDWPHAVLERDDARIAALLADAFAPGSRARPLALWLRGTNLQIAVWRALLALPPGTALPYRELARLVEAPRAVRAVASALARNPVAWLVPCHRVLRSDGGLGGYAWGLDRKAAVLASEDLARR